MADEAAGVVQLIRMVLAEEDAARVEKEMQAALKKGTDPKAPVANIEKTTSAIEKLGKIILRVAEFMIARELIHGIIDFGKEAVAAALEARKAWGLLDNAVKNAGGNVAKTREEAEHLADTFKRAGVAGHDEFARSLRTLIQISGDVDKSLANMGVVADLAAARNLTLEESAGLVAKAMNGQVTMLHRLGIEIPVGTDAVKALAERFKGAAQAIDPAVREQKRLHEEWHLFKEAVGEAVLGIKEGESFTKKLTTVIEHMTDIVKNNRGAILDMGHALFWVSKEVIGNVVLRAYEGWADVLSITATALAKLQKLDPWHFGPSSPESAKQLEEFSKQAAKASVEAAELRKAILAPEPKPGDRKPGVEGLPNTPPGGAVFGVQGDASGDEKRRKSMQDDFKKAMSERISAASDAMKIDDLRMQGMQELIELEDILNDNLQNGNLSFQDRVEMMKNVKDVQDAMVDGLKGMAAQAGVSEEALKSLWEGNWRAALKSIAKDALFSAGWNVAKAIEMFARASGAISLGNFPSAAAASTAGKGHLLAAAKWAALAGGAGAASSAGGGGSGNGGSSTGPTDLGSDAANKVQQPSTKVEIYVDGFDPDSAKQQDWLHAANQNIKQRYGDNSTVTVMRR